MRNHCGFYLCSPSFLTDPGRFAAFAPMVCMAVVNSSEASLIATQEAYYVGINSAAYIWFELTFHCLVVGSGCSGHSPQVDNQLFNILTD